MASDSNKWYKKAFGDNLIHCKEVVNHNLNVGDRNYVQVDTIFDDFYKAHGRDGTLIIGVYFTPVEGAPDESTNYLVQLYQSINNVSDELHNSNLCDKNMKDQKVSLEVISVFLTSSIHWLDRCTIDEAKVYDQLKDFPWYAIPVGDRDRMIRLTRRYQIKSLTPSLILLNGQNGKIITKHGRERILEDPTGLNFPWKPRPLHVVLENVQLQRGGKNECSESTDYQNLKGSIIGFYFSAHWCPPCKGFTPQLIETYNLLKRMGVNFEVIFVSSDRSAESHKTYFQTMPWLGVPYSDQECRRELASLYGVQGIPTLVIVDFDGTVITYDGRGEINDDPTGQMFPWRPRLVNFLNERHSAKLHDTPAIVLFVEGDDTEMEFAETILSRVVKDFVEKYQNDEIPLEFFVASDNETSDTLREFIGMDDIVPLLTVVNIPDGTWTALEEGIDVTEETVMEFVNKFVKNELPMQSICSEQTKT
ncbi:hypothetical protein RUM43_010920 [Polyplax serrata]|uniref:Thioredoxin domain-containing protein n=1 Tax=Polyplax serrata TaxID=468196 RepID=A0AAN8S0K4_POLSC